MVLTSISTISSFSFFSDSHSNSNYTLFRNRPFPSFLVGFPKPPFSNATFKLKSSSSLSSSTQQENGSPEQFLQNNSIADFMRFKKGIDDDADLLQTSIVSYKNKFPSSLLKPSLQVDLVSTVHIGEKEYFLALQKKLESYDCVLYEMIAPKETLEKMRKGTESTYDSGFGISKCVMKQMAQILGLVYQLDCLNYQFENWEHADLYDETYELLMKEKRENLPGRNDMTAILETIEAISRRPIPEDLDPWRSKLLWAACKIPMPLVGSFIIIGVFGYYPVMEGLSRLGFSSAMKAFIAKLVTSDSLLGTTPEVDENSVKVGERNRVAIERLRSAMDKGHNKIAILYGGSHMPDLGRRLREEFDLIPSGLEWITAWFIRKSKRKVNTGLLLRLMIVAVALLISSPVWVLDLWFWKLVIGTAVKWSLMLARKFFGMSVIIR